MFLFSPRVQSRQAFLSSFFRPQADLVSSLSPFLNKVDDLYLLFSRPVTARAPFDPFPPPFFSSRVVRPWASPCCSFSPSPPFLTARPPLPLLLGSLFRSPSPCPDNDRLILPSSCPLLEYVVNSLISFYRRNLVKAPAFFCP